VDCQKEKKNSKRLNKRVREKMAGGNCITNNPWDGDTLATVRERQRVEKVSLFLSEGLQVDKTQTRLVACEEL